MESTDDIFKRAKSNAVDKQVGKTRKVISIVKIVNHLKKTGSVSDTARILGTTNQNIYQRLERKGIDHRDFTDYTEDKALSHEIIQYRIANGLSGDDIKKMPGGSKVLAICQLQDKISTLRDGTTNKNNSLSIIINLANKSEDKRQEIDITPA